MTRPRPRRLRRYNALSTLRPSHVIPFTGYHCYSESGIGRTNALRGLRDTGLGTAEIEQLDFCSRSADVERDFGLIATLMEHAATSDALFRNIYRDFLGEAAEMTGSARIADAAEDYSEIADQWSRVIALLEVAAASGHRIPVEEAAGLMRSISAAELTAMTRLRRDGIADTRCCSLSPPAGRRRRRSLFRTRRRKSSSGSASRPRALSGPRLPRTRAARHTVGHGRASVLRPRRRAARPSVLLTRRGRGPSGGRGRGLGRGGRGRRRGLGGGKGHWRGGRRRRVGAGWSRRRLRRVVRRSLSRRLTALRRPHRLLLEGERLLLGPHLLLKGELLQHDLLRAHRLGLLMMNLVLVGEDPVLKLPGEDLEPAALQDRDPDGGIGSGMILNQELAREGGEEGKNRAQYDGHAVQRLVAEEEESHEPGQKSEQELPDAESEAGGDHRDPVHREAVLLDPHRNQPQQDMGGVLNTNLVFEHISWVFM